MIAAIRTWLATRAIAILAGLLATALLGLAVQTWRVDRLKASNARLAGEVKAANQATKLSEAMRAQEKAQDKASYSNLSARCEWRVMNALDAARAIQEVVNYGNTQSSARSADNGGADRAIVPASQLRRIIGQGAAVGVPAGSHGTTKP